MAIVGSGISGLTAAFLLTRHDHRATVRLPNVADWAGVEPQGASARVQAQLSCAYTALQSEEGVLAATAHAMLMQRRARWIRSQGRSLHVKPTTPVVHLRSGAKVTLYEKEKVFGGHTLTDDF